MIPLILKKVKMFLIYHLWDWQVGSFPRQRCQVKTLIKNISAKACPMLSGFLCLHNIIHILFISFVNGSLTFSFFLLIQYLLIILFFSFIYDITFLNLFDKFLSSINWLLNNRLFWKLLLTIYTFYARC